MADPISRDEFMGIVATGLARSDQFNTGQTELGPDDSMDKIEHTTACRSRSEHFTQLSATILTDGFEPEAQRDQGEAKTYCAYWIRHTDAVVYARTRPWAGAEFATGREVLDVLRVCILVKASDLGCVTTYAPAAARLLRWPGKESSSVHLMDRNVDDLRNELAAHLLTAIDKVGTE